MKVMLACFALAEGLQVKIPKQRGSGFLKQPLGHYYEDWLLDVDYDISGLDGYLNICCGFVDSEEKQKSILDDIMPILVKKFGFEWRLVKNSKTWWDATDQ